MSNTLDFNVIQHNTPEYHEAIILRQAILRTPLGLTYSQQEQDDESEQIHVIGKIGKKIVCSASIMMFEGYCKIRQVAVTQDRQQSGIGTQLMNYCEKYIQQQGYQRIELNARSSVLNFYLKNGYSPIGEEFMEINLPHQKMQKWIK